ncbi:MAG: hypothetical protein Q7I97_05855, partial [Thermovirgaceae bacterium]|nr:hypothetical protein [Thermovirgaceae bacterium]
LLCAGALLLAAVALGTAWGGGGQIVLDADRVEYDQAGGFAVATGNVRMSRDMLRVFAPKIEYSADEQTIEAFSAPGERVVLMQGAQRLEGDHLNLDMISGEGILTNAKGSFPAEKGEIYASGSDVATYRFDTARTAGVMKGQVPEPLRDRVYQWKTVSTTTCKNTEIPHYNLVSKRVVIIPGYRVIATRPKVYIGGRYILTYPFDYMIDLTEGSASRSQLMPQMIYESEKGIGVTMGAPLMIGDISAKWKAFLWSKVDFEGALSLDYRFSDNVSLFADAWYSWDSDKQEKRFRPQWGANYNFNGWTGRLWWSQAESVTVEKTLGDTFTGTLWRRPEFSINSPSWELPGSIGSFGIHGIWGEYETTSSTGTDTVTIQRTGIGGSYSGSVKMGDVRPSWGISYLWYDYGSRDRTQDILSARFGLSWPIGPVSMTSTWTKSWADGGSPMSWDAYSDSEAFYQGINVPIGSNWSIYARGGYNLVSSTLDEMYYRLTFANSCCYRLDLSYRDDLIGEDDWAGIVFVLNAFPSKPFFFNTRELSELNQ